MSVAEPRGSVEGLGPRSGFAAGPAAAVIGVGDVPDRPASREKREATRRGGAELKSVDSGSFSKLIQTSALQQFQERDWLS